MEFFAFYALAVYMAVVIAWSYSYRVVYDMQDRLYGYRMYQWRSAIDNARQQLAEASKGGE